jgi:hypothetical protein
MKRYALLGECSPRRRYRIVLLHAQRHWLLEGSLHSLYSPAIHPHLKIAASLPAVSEKLGKMPAPPLNSSQEATVQALNEIRLVISLGKNRSASKESHLRELYKPKRSNQPIYFYVQDGNGFPIHRISNCLDRGQGTVYPSLELDITFDPTKWPNTLPRPPNYDGSWPPISREDLLGDVTQDPLCVYCCRSICRHRYDLWLKKQPTAWTNRLAIMDTGNTGYGLFARQDMFSGAILGSYSGAFIPQNASNESDYLTNIWIGLWSDDNFSEGRLMHCTPELRCASSTPLALRTRYWSTGLWEWICASLSSSSSTMSRLAIRSFSATAQDISPMGSIVGVGRSSASFWSRSRATRVRAGSQTHKIIWRSRVVWSGRADVGTRESKTYNAILFLVQSALHNFNRQSFFLLER